MKPSAAQLRQLKRDNLAYPEALVPIPQDQWPVPPFIEKRPRIAVWRSRKFMVQAFDEGGGVTRLSINRTEWDERTGRFRDDISWGALQLLKLEAGFPNQWAVEVYPANTSVVNVANMRHLWLLPDAPPFAWNAKLSIAEAAA